MQLGTQGTDAKIGNASAPSSFKIAASTVTFEILSSGLYGDKIGAVIRELSCNAWDAHVAAGKRHEPFEVHLPTQFTPIFTVKDTGTGLRFIKGGCETCHGTGIIGKGSAAEIYCEDCNHTGDYDAVMRLYCTYFASDKNQSNEFIGALGLGSKSPFAYTNKKTGDGSTQSGGFTVTNHYEGRTYIYTAMVKNGFPTVVPMQVIDTPNEPNGLEVSFPVDRRDIWEFENKAANVFEFFFPRPKLNKAVTIKNPTYSVKTDLWGMRTDADTAQGDALRAIQGNVQYSVGNIDQSRLTEAQKKLVSMPIDLFFNIGELSVAASREALQLDDKTIHNILARLDIVQDKLLEEIKKQIDGCKTGWEARLKVRELTMQPGMGALVNDAYNRGLLNGAYTFFKLEGITKEGSNTVVINELDYQHIEVTAFRYSDRRSAKKAKKEPLFEFATQAKRAEAFRDLGSNITEKKDYDLKLSVDQGVIFVINDLNTKADRYVSYLLQGDRIAAQKAWDGISEGGTGEGAFTVGKYRKALVINRLTRSIPMGRAGDEAVALLDRIGNPPVVKASELKAKFDPLLKAEKDVQVVKRERMNVRILRHYAERTRCSSGGGWKKQWQKGDDNFELNDSTATKFYVMVSGSSIEPMNLPGFYYARNFIDFVNTVRESDLFPEISADTPIFGIFGIKAGSKLLPDPLFIDFLPFVRARVTETITPAKEMELSLAVKPFSSNWKSVMEYVAEHPQLLSVDSPFRQFALAIHKAEAADRRGHANLVTLAKTLGIAINNTADYNQAWQKVIKNYPILKICSRNTYGSGTIEEKTVLVDYIRYTDEQNRRLVLTDVRVITDDETKTEDEEETVNV